MVYLPFHKAPVSPEDRPVCQAKASRGRDFVIGSGQASMVVAMGACRLYGDSFWPQRAVAGMFAQDLVRPVLVAFGTGDLAVLQKHDLDL